MLDLLNMQKHFIKAHIREGDSVADFTMGNGYDTVFLSNAIGPSGTLTAFDIQPSALEATSERLRKSGCPSNWRLICDSHSNALKYIDGTIKAGIFNLGYLPGSGNKALTTKRSSTLPAVKDALSILGDDSILIVAVYPGHQEGAAEGKELIDFFSTQSRYKLSVSQIRMLNSPDSPFFIAAETKATR